jgi:hypothetical protein
MKHYVVVSKAYTINEAGDEILDDVNILMVEHSKEDAFDDIERIKKNYIDEDYHVENEDFHKRIVSWKPPALAVGRKRDHYFSSVCCIKIRANLCN